MELILAMYVSFIQYRKNTKEYISAVKTFVFWQKMEFDFYLRYFSFSLAVWSASSRILSKTWKDNFPSSNAEDSNAEESCKKKI